MDVAAFPCHGSMGEVAQTGMTLRDYFAAHAIALVARQADLANAGTPEMAAACFEFADAMLVERAAPLIERVNERSRADWLDARATRYEELLRDLLRAADAGDVGTEVLRAALAAAREQLDEDEIPF